MNSQQFVGGDERFLRQYEYDDDHVVVADFGVSEGSIDVDVVGSTAIVVVDAGDRVTETEFELPEGDAQVAVNNGVLVITIDK